MYIKYILLQLQLFILFFVGLVIYPVAYLFRHSIDKRPILWKWLLLYWFTNSDEDNYIDNWYGVYEIYNGDYEKFTALNWWQKFLLSYEWGAFRNIVYSYMLLFKPLQGIKHSEKKLINEGVGGYFGWRNKTKHGKQFVTWYVMNKKYFRYSFTRKMKLKLLGYTHINFMAGAGEKRFILKLRFFKL